MSLPAQVLIVDDSVDNRFLLQSLLEDEGYIVTVAENGAKALDHIAGKGEAQLPDLILLDVMMPGMSGYEVTRWVRGQAELPFIPILLVTAHEQSNVVEGLDAGADDFIRKPFDVEELLARVRALLRLKFSVDAEREIAQQRDDFVSRLTHDLRTPLVAANRMLALVQREALGTVAAEAQDAIAQTIRNNEHLLAMVNTLLEVYRHEAGRKTMTFAPFDLGRLLKEVTAELQPLALTKGLDLKLDLAQTPSWSLVGDRLEIRRTLVNLIGNAIKFTDVGHVHIALHLDEGDQGHQWVLEVHDTGSGIAPEAQDTVFAWFRPGNHRRSGSGLGLHLARRIAHAHGGNLTLHSSSEAGSLFVLTLPLQPTAPSGTAGAENAVVL
ncbi:hybrid sensor histidine kinase/response regulator [Leptolyngbya sp. PCC 6406]|uniref:hybrid sensor histidine kinase/response regulator n=1 Tax=Leptolyngbya sp. PCC 6406 TaxID=1173264 RepID=UPI0002AC8BF1|nr:hybrid sensor histidine kinase/response regulator [Leptolyngbya sp. PCC 6406]